MDLIKQDFDEYIKASKWYRHLLTFYDINGAGVVVLIHADNQQKIDNVRI